MLRTTFSLLVLILLFSACAPAVAEVPPSTSEPPTATPTETPVPTNTPSPTETPTSTPTLTPTPVPLGGGGDYVALSCGDHTVHLVRLSSGEITPITETEASYGDLKWSEDGTHLYFAQTDGLILTAVYDYDVVNDSLEVLHPFPDIDQEEVLSNPRLSPDMSLYANINPDRDNILIFEPGSEEPRALLQTPLPGLWDVNWSANSQYVYFSYGAVSAREIFRANVDTGEPEQLTSNGSQDTNPLPAPDGQKVAYAAITIGPSSTTDGVYVYDIEQGTATRLVDTGGVQSIQAWSPDSSRLLVLAAHGAEMLAYYILTDMEGNTWEIPNAPTVSRDSFTQDQMLIYLHAYSEWSPDSSVLALNADDNLMLVDAAEQEVLFEATETPREAAYAWSPDGDWLVYHAAGSDDNPDVAGLYIVRRDGSEARQISEKAGCFELAWQP